MLHRYLIPIFVFCILTAHGQESDTAIPKNLMSLGIEELAQVKVNVSSIKPLDLLSTPSSVTVVDREMIEQYNFQTLAEALATVPGIDIPQTIIDRNVTTSRGILQNFYSNKVLFMIDNVPNWQPIYGDFHLERIDINDVERIEVLKGPASVLYGTNAYSGVVNIILRDKKSSSIDAHSLIGYPMNLAAGFNSLLKKDKFKVFMAVNASVDRKKPYLMEGDANLAYNGDTSFMFQERYQTGNFIVKGTYLSHSIILNGFSYNHTYLGAQPSYTMGGGTMVSNEGIMFNYQLNHTVGNKIHVFGNAGMDNFRRDFALSADRSMLVKVNGIRYASELKMNHHLTNYLSYDLGGHAEIRDSRGHETWYGVTDTLVRSNLINDDDVYEGSLFFQPEFKVGDFALVVGGRYTLNSRFGDDLSFRGTALYRLNKKNSIKAIIGQSFRVPTMFELYFDHPTVKGNVDLNPEKSISYELAYLRNTRNLHIGIAGYIASYSDLIKRVAIDSLIPVYQNAQEFQGAGIEVETRYSNKNFGSFYLNYNYVTGMSSDNHNYQYVPEHTCSFGINKTIEKFYVYGKGQYVSSTVGPIETIDWQFFTDLGFGFKHNKNGFELNHTFTIKNITNSSFLIPQYIRQQSDVNAIPTMAYGRSVIYTIILRH